MTDFTLKEVPELEAINEADIAPDDENLVYDSSVGVVKRVSKAQGRIDRTVPINSVASFGDIDLTKLTDRQAFFLISFGPTGSHEGGPLFWDASEPRTNHDGRYVFSPTVPAPSDFNSASDVQDYRDGVGDAFPGNNGCFIRAGFDQWVIPLSDITSLPPLNTAALVDGQQFSRREWWPDTGVGGVDLYWDPNEPVANHNGGTIIDPAKISELNTTTKTFGTYFTPDTVSGNTGCFIVPVEDPAPITIYGAVPGATDPADFPVQAALDSNSSVLVDSGRFLINGTLTSQSCSVESVSGVFVHKPAQDDVDCLILAGDDLHVKGLTVENKDTGAGDFFTGWAFVLSGDRCLAESCKVFSAWNENRNFFISGQNRKQSMVSSGLTINDCTSSKIVNCHVSTGVYVALRHFGAIESVIESCTTKDTYRGFMVSGDEASVLTKHSIIKDCVFVECLEKGGKYETLCTDNSVDGCSFYDCLDVPGGSPAEGELITLKSERSYFVNNYIDCNGTVAGGSQAIVRTGASGVPTDGQDSVIADNRVQNFTPSSGSIPFGFNIVDSHRLTLEGNYLANVVVGFSVQVANSTDVSVNNNHFGLGGTDRTLSNAKSARLQFNNNHIASSGRFGVYHSLDAISEADLCSYCNNTIIGSSDQGVYVNRARGVKIIGNTEQGSPADGIEMTNVEDSIAANNVASSYRFAGTQTNSLSVNNVTHTL